jgi:glutathione S-transferase
MLKVWGRRSSFNVQKVMWLIGELELAHEHIDAGGKFGGLDLPDFLAMNPHGRVPVIQDGDAVVWESHAILRYLAARHSAGKFWSYDPVARARVDGWMDWSQTSLQPDFLSGVFWGFYRTPEDRRNWPAIRAALNRCAVHFEKLDRLPRSLRGALATKSVGWARLALPTLRTRAVTTSCAPDAAQRAALRGVVRC